MNPNYKKEEQEILEKAFFSFIGYQHAQNILNDLDYYKDEIQDIETPESLDKTVFEFIQESENVKRKTKLKKVYNKLIQTKAQKVAAIIIILAISMTMLTVSVEAFRVRVFNMILEQREKYLEIRLDEEEPMEGVKGNKQEEHYIPSYIPDGFELESEGGSGETATLIYKNKNNQTILFDQAPHGTVYQIDSEDAIREDIKINGFKGISLTKGDRITLYWNNGETSFIIISDIEFQELIRMAESITKNK